MLQGSALLFSGSGGTKLVEGTKKLYYPISGGSFFNTSVSNLNGFATRSIAQGSNGYIRPDGPPIQNDWVPGTDATIRVLHAFPSTPDALERLSIRVGYRFQKIGEHIGDDFTYLTYEDVVEAELWYHVRNIDFTIPAADIDPTADMIKLEVRRQNSTAPEFPGNFHILGVQLLYTARGIDLDG